MTGTLSVTSGVSLASTLSTLGAATLSSLSVGGTTTLQGAVKIGGTLSVLGVTTGPSVSWTTSDRALKTNVRPISRALFKVTKLRGVYYDWLSEESGRAGSDERRHVGLIAQDVLKVIPEAVNVVKEDNFMGVDYQSLVGLLVEAIRELAEKDQLLVAKVLMLEMELNFLKIKLGELVG